MERVLEPELMDDEIQARAYADTDFSSSDTAFVERFTELFGTDFNGHMIDLGCGPGNISLRMAQAFPLAHITGLDGAENMLDIARQRASELPIEDGKIDFIQACLPCSATTQYDAIINNSLLHHLHNPDVLWRSLHTLAKPCAAILCIDLRRPETTTAAQNLVDTYAGDAADILREDFYNSLLAAFTPAEVKQQLAKADLAYLDVTPVADRYVAISGTYANLPNKV